MTSVRVIAAVIERGGRWLLGRRPETKRHGGLWEFPGGKIRSGETPFEAAERELAEELGLSVLGIGECLFTMRDGNSPFVIDFFEVDVTGDAQPIEHSELGWFTAKELAGKALAPTDAVFVESRLGALE